MEILHAIYRLVLALYILCPLLTMPMFFIYEVHAQDDLTAHQDPTSHALLQEDPSTHPPEELGGPNTYASQVLKGANATTVYRVDFSAIALQDGQRYMRVGHGGSPWVVGRIRSVWVVVGSFGS